MSEKVSTFQITWEDHAPYNSEDVRKMLEFIDNNIEGLLPLYPREKKRIVHYAEENNININVLLSMRNQVCGDKEYMLGGKFDRFRDKCIEKFNVLLSKIDGSNDEIWKNIINFYASIKIPPRVILDYIKDTDEYANLDEKVIELLSKPINDRLETDRNVKDKSAQFEEDFDKWLSESRIKYKTEKDIKVEEIHHLTPDFLFDVPIVIKQGNSTYDINWIDVKNYFLCDIKMLVKGLKKQMLKYNEAFGQGAFVFHYGFDPSVDIPNVLILNGEFI